MYEKREYDKEIFAPTGKRMTIGLFKETAPNPAEAPCSLAEWNKLYVEIGDPTGYTQAMHLLGDWEHWNVLKNSNVTAPYIKQWEHELEVKIRSEAIKHMIAASKNERGQASAKWLAEAGFKIEGEKRDKRTKDRKTEEEAIKSEVSSKVKEDMERLGLTVVGGAK